MDTPHYTSLTETHIKRAEICLYIPRQNSMKSPLSISNRLVTHKAVWFFKSSLVRERSERDGETSLCNKVSIWCEC